MKLASALLLACLGGCSRQDAAPALDAAPPAASAGRLAVPGMGVSLVPPPGVRLVPVGTTLTDDTGKVLVSVVVGPAGNALGIEAGWHDLYPSSPETLRVGDFGGTLRHRRRDRDGGDFDGWALLLTSDTSCLAVTLVDKDRPTGRWQAWRDHVLSVRWQPGGLDPERAFGLSPGTIAGMQLDRTSGGVLVYRATSTTDPVTLELTALPLVLPPDPQTCFQLLQKSTTGEASMDRPSLLAAGGLPGCEADTISNGRAAGYWAIVSAPNAGGTVVAVGSSPPASSSTWRPRFEAAVRALHPTR